jgi:hypothetical protein
MTPGRLAAASREHEHRFGVVSRRWMEWTAVQRAFAWLGAHLVDDRIA